MKLKLKISLLLTAGGVLSPSDENIQQLLIMSASSRLLDDQEMSSPYKSLHDNYVSNPKGVRCSVSALLGSAALLVLGILLAVVVIERLKYEDQINEALSPHPSLTSCDDSEQSSIVLVETLPLGVNYGKAAGRNMYEGWKDLLSSARERVDVASFYWSLTADDINVNSSEDGPGREILQEFKALPSRNVSVRVVSSVSTVAPNSTDLTVLEEHGVEVRRVNFRRLTRGILHSKFWIVDGKHVYIGSANMDWRALTQVKELGVIVYNSSSLAADLLKIFQSYWLMGQTNASIPNPWPHTFDTHINMENPLNVNLSEDSSRVYISASPPAFCPESRTRDLDAILSAIGEAQDFIHVSVMEFYPASKFFHLHGFWPVLEDALKRSAFERNVSVRLLLSCGRESDPAVWPFIRSFSSLHSPKNNIHIEVKLFIIPAGNQSHVPYSRINHSKYMVTETVAYVGTSNWSADYFNTTAGVALVVSQDALQGNSFHQQLRDVFDRDWSSDFAVPPSELQQSHDCAFSSHTHS